jgi:hypothetical protein
MFVLLNKKAGEDKQAWLQSKQYFYTFKAKIFVDSNEIIAGQFEGLPFQHLSNDPPDMS